MADSNLGAAVAKALRDLAEYMSDKISVAQGLNPINERARRGLFSSTAHEGKVHALFDQAISLHGRPDTELRAFNTAMLELLQSNPAAFKAMTEASLLVVKAGAIATRDKAVLDVLYDRDRGATDETWEDLRRRVVDADKLITPDTEEHGDSDADITPNVAREDKYGDESWMNKEY